jgi:transcription-repair coupling factor (superfamily II helicase)
MPNKARASAPPTRSGGSASIARQDISSASPVGAIAAYLLAKRQTAGEGGLLYLSASERRAEHLGAVLHAFDAHCGVMVFPRWDSLPYDGISPSLEITGRRASVLRRLAEGLESPLIIATADAVVQKVPPRGVWGQATFRLKPGLALEISELEAFLRRTGYALEPQVSAPGEAAFQSQVIDIFPAGALDPIRLEHSRGRITGLFSYDPADQKTLDKLPEVIIDAASEVILREGEEGGDVASSSLAAHYDRLATLFDYMGTAAIVMEEGVEDRRALWMQQIKEAYEARRSLPGIDGSISPPERLYLTENAWREQLFERECEVLPTPTSDDCLVPTFATSNAPAAALRDFLKQQVESKRRIVLAGTDDRDLATLERRARISIKAGVNRVTSWEEALAAPLTSLCALRADLERGFMLPSIGVAVVTTADLLGSRAAHNVPMGQRHLSTLGEEESLSLGDVVVHLERGVGILRGLESVSAPGMPDHDVVRLEYAGQRRVLVAVEELASIWKYSSDQQGISLDQAEGDAWTKRSQKLQTEISATAEKLVTLEQQRSKQKADALVPPPADYERFVAAFPYFTTMDQASAVEDVLADLGSGRPMDRLVCGDVGFGKTEIALRAAAAAVLSGKQVAVAVPTTVLAGQHAATFSRRFSSLGINVRQLSRVIPAAEARAVKKGLADGSVRLVIGTHALAAKGVAFKNLGLLIIDEEQKFGTKDKERLRALGSGVHLLTLTATPIPRTMRLALVGLRSLSVIATPPARRLPIRTLLTPFGSTAVETALRYEKRRGGQSFFVCPRIEDMDPMQERLRQIVPELKVTVLHGRMPAATIDDVMLRFAEGEGDVLLTTNIIESGLDLPRVNTIMVWRADRFGLSQLHQLRGRVGRGNRRGFAYLLTDPEAKMTRVAEKRLQTLQELNELGSGFAISRRDLDFRGGGDLLGEEQAGHLKLVGSDLYRHLLERALSQARGEEILDDYVPKIHLEQTATLPSDYVPDPQARLNLYARLAKARSEAEIEDLEDEIGDRYGAAPAALTALFDTARLREACRRSGVARIDVGPKAIALTFHSAPPRGAAVMTDRNAAIHWSGERLSVSRSADQDAVELIRDTLLDLSEASC